MNKNNISLVLAVILGTTAVTACSSISDEQTITETIDSKSEQANDLQEEQRIIKYKPLAKITYEQAKQAGEAAIGEKLMRLN
ncbi:MAG: hypothetical protein WBA39_13635 [Rivularia sp. (in: cyanobacteria)]